MRGNRIHTRAKRRIRRDHRSVATDEFEHQVLRDGVYEDVIQDDQLAQLEDTIASLEDVRDLRREEVADDGEDYAAEIARSIEHLHGTVSRRVMEICAERCRAVLMDGDEWVERGWRDVDEIRAAQAEARTWLLNQPDVCERLWGENAARDIVGASLVEVEADD